VNKGIIRHTIGRLLQINALFLLLPVLVSVIYNEPLRYLISFLSVAIVSVVVGSLMTIKKPEMTMLYQKEGVIIVALSWVILSLVGSFPFMINGDIPSFINAFFETTSGFTTSGATILNDVEVLSRSSHFWRTFTTYIGGMGVLVFALAILPKTSSNTVHIMKAEMPGPTFGKLMPKLTDSARILYAIYVSLTAVTIVLLIIADMPVYDAIIHGIGAAATAGFSIYNQSIGVYDSLAIETILSTAMIIFGINFNLFFLVFTKHIKEALSSEELKWYLSFILIGVVLITIQLTSFSYGFWNALRDSFFTVASIVSTTGYTIVNFNHWPLFSRVVLLLLMFVGGMAGSTSGGLKTSRIAIGIKSAIAEFKRKNHPNRVVSVRFENERVDTTTIRSIANYIIAYLILFVIVLLLISIDTPDFTTAFSSVAAVTNNIGQGLEAVGPDASFSPFSNFSKMILSLSMIMGRLEIFPILVLLSKNTWQDHY